MSAMIAGPAITNASGEVTEYEPGYVNWEGKDPSKLKLLYVPKHLDIVEGSDVVSSSFDSIYPKGILIGKIISVNREVNSNFYDIDISSSQNFYSISKVYVINNFMYEEKKSLEKITDEE